MSDHRDAATAVRISILGVSGKLEVLNGNATCVSMRMKVENHLVGVQEARARISPAKHRSRK
jgi:hypothetical protein